MSDTVKRYEIRWHGMTASYHVDQPCWPGGTVVLSSDYDAALARAEKAEYQIKVLRDLADIDTEERDRLLATLLDRDNDLALMRAERDHLAAVSKDYTQANLRVVKLRIEAEDERDRLKARGDLYSELAEALGDDPCDSHKSRVEHAKKLKAERDRLVAQVKAMQETTTFKLNDYDRLAARVQQLEEQVDHWRIKGLCYGNMVNGVTPILEKAGYSMDSSLVTGGAVAGVRLAVEALVADRDRLAAECAGLEAENTRFVKERDLLAAKLVEAGECHLADEQSVCNMQCEIDRLAATVDLFLKWRD